jgi:hypothetical protein
MGGMRGPESTCADIVVLPKSWFSRKDLRFPSLEAGCKNAGRPDRSASSALRGDLTVRSSIRPAPIIVIAFLWPGITLVALTYMFGIYAIIGCGRRSKASALFD